MAAKKGKKKGAAGQVTVLGWQGGTKGKAQPARVPDGAPGPLARPEPGRVRIRSQNGKYELVARLGPDAAALTPQTPRVEQVEIPWRASQSQWLGQQSAGLVIDLVLDAYPWGSIEDEWATLEDMARPTSAGRSSGAPSPLQVAGSVPGEDRWWQIAADGIDPSTEVGEGVIRMAGGYRARQRLTLTLVQWLPVGRTDPAGRSNQRTSTGGKVKRPDWIVNEGETLVTIALKALGDGSRWREIAEKNPYGKGKTKKARRSPEDVKRGDRLKLPQA